MFLRFSCTHLIVKIKKKLARCKTNNFNWLSKNYTFIFLVTGHAPEFNVVQTKNNKDRIILSNVPGRPKDKKYVFAQLHVHFGRDETQGSEHCIDNIFKPMEVKFIIAKFVVCYISCRTNIFFWIESR